MPAQSLVRMVPAQLPGSVGFSDTLLPRKEFWEGSGHYAVSHLNTPGITQRGWRRLQLRHFWHACCRAKGQVGCIAWLVM